jgi:hypothetical protein
MSNTRYMHTGHRYKYNMSPAYCMLYY